MTEERSAIQDVDPITTREEFQPTNENTDWGSVEIDRRREIKYGMVEVTDTYDALDNDRYIICIPSAGNMDVNIPSSNPGKVYTIKNIGASDIVTVIGQTNIDGAANFALSTQYDFVTIVRNNIDWSIVSQT